MLVKSFLAWMDKASMRERAEAAAMLAEAYLAGHYGGDSAEEMEAALASVLDDPSLPVRRALARTLAESPAAPRHLVLALAADQPEVSALLIARSPLLTEADLIDLATTSEGLALVGLALRHEVPARLAREIIARKMFDAVHVLVGNHQAEIDEPDLLAALAAFGNHAKLRAAMLGRPGLPASVRHALMHAVAGSLCAFVTEGGFLPAARNARILDETLQGGTVAIARQVGRDLAGFVRYLRWEGHLTPALLLRAVLAGEMKLLDAALAELCGLDIRKVEMHVGSGSVAALTALLRRAELPGFLVPVMIAALREAGRHDPAAFNGDFMLPVILVAQQAALAVPGEEGIRLIALLRRYEAEAARQQARRMAETLRREAIDEEQARLSLLPLDIGPEMLRLAQAAPLEEARPPSPAFAPLDRRIARARGLVLDEPIPDLRSVIAEWRAEQMAQGMTPAGEAPRAANSQPARNLAA